MTVTVTKEQLIELIEGYKRGSVTFDYLRTVLNRTTEEVGLIMEDAARWREHMQVEPVLRDTARYILDRFNETEAAGYHTRDRQFVIDLLSKALEGHPAAPAPVHVFEAEGGGMRVVDLRPAPDLRWTNAMCALDVCEDEPASDHDPKCPRAPAPEDHRQQGYYQSQIDAPAPDAATVKDALPKEPPPDGSLVFWNEDGSKRQSNAAAFTRDSLQRYGRDMWLAGFHAAMKEKA